MEKHFLLFFSSSLQMFLTHRSDRWLRVSHLVQWTCRGLILRSHAMHLWHIFSSKPGTHIRNISVWNQKFHIQIPRKISQFDWHSLVFTKSIDSPNQIHLNFILTPTPFINQCPIIKFVLLSIMSFSIMIANFALIFRYE